MRPWNANDTINPKEPGIKPNVFGCVFSMLPISEYQRQCNYISGILALIPTYDNSECNKEAALIVSLRVYHIQAFQIKIFQNLVKMAIMLTEFYPAEAGRSEFRKKKQIHYVTFGKI